MSEPIDCSRLAEISEGDTAFERELLVAYLEDARHCLQQLDLAIANCDWDSARAVAHQLKGSSGNVGATIAAEICAQIEHQTRKQQVMLLPDLQAAIDAVGDRISSWGERS